MANTTNFGWETPDDTDYVYQGAAAMRTLGNSIDASLVDLKGGTTGQVLAKASNTDLDFTWSSVDPLTILDAKADLITATAADTPARLAVGTNGQVLTADSTTSTGLKWASVSAGGMTVLASGNFPTGADNFTLSSISSDYIDLKLVLLNVRSSSQINVALRFNGDSNSVYFHQQTSVQTASGMANDNIQLQLDTFDLQTGSHTDCTIFNYANTTAYKSLQSNTIFPSSSTQWITTIVKGVWRSTNAINSITVYDRNANNFTGGTYILYGVK